MRRSLASSAQMSRSACGRPNQPKGAQLDGLSRSPSWAEFCESRTENGAALILFGLYTGQRLGDITKLTWRNVDLQRGELSLVTRKTKRRQLVPLAAPLLKYLEEAHAGDDPAEPLFPKAHASKRIGTLSNQFYEILVSAGLAAKRSHKSNGKGQRGRRSFNEVSFHALRHTATSLMKNAGISPAIVQDLIGHESPEISAHYTVIEESAKRRAIQSLPDVTSLRPPET